MTDAKPLDGKLVRLSQRASSPEQMGVNDLLEIMAALRTPVTGCPWDLVQDFSTIAPYTIEEAYEVADAIERQDVGDLREELGDLLFQVVYHAQMAAENETFSFADVVDGICRKMIRRHPHVFGDEDVKAAIDVKGLWDRVKAQEKSDNGGNGRRRLLDDVPLALPALSRAAKLQNKAAKVGFDWPELSPVLEKLREELEELEEASQAKDQEKIEEEFGDFLLVLTNVGRHLKVDAESALRRANAKFVRRFAFIEDELLKMGQSPEQSSLEQMDDLWDKAKEQEG